jgi:type I restriction enzyme R subunit
VKGLPQRNLAKEMLERLLRDEIRKRSQKNAVRAKAFSEMLQAALLKYTNNAIETAQLITMLIELAKEMRSEDARTAELNLTDEEIAFYDALAENESAVQVLGDEKLRIIASELVKTVKASVTLDWSLRETAKANIRRIIRRILKQYGYPPDAQAKAVETVLEQAELLCAADAA